MKKIIIGVVLSLFIYSCSHLSTSDKRIRDSIASIALKMKNDSIKKEQIRLDSLSHYAWGDAKFGMTKKEVLKTSAFKGGSVYSSDKITLFFASINNKNFEINAVFDKEDKLFRISIEDSYRTADYYNVDILPRVKALRDYFERLYGEPSIVHDIPDVYELEHNSKVDVYEWFVGSGVEEKLITITIDEDYFTTEYRVTCKIIYC
jgi:hypothetical protein